ncbi:MAG: LamG-like jellyroll fold domain-containing protein [Candidatus Paceibacterota bacterium]
MKQFKKGFTLIELLAVLSIMSFISSIVIASLSSAREKARITAAAEANANLSHSFVTMAYWSFDDGTANDYVGGNNGTPSAGITFSTNTFNGKGKSASFNGGGGIIVADKPDLNFGTSRSFALGSWVKTTSKAHKRVLSKGHYGFSPGYVLQIHCCDIDGSEQLTAGINTTYMYTSNVQVSDNKWHYLAAVFDRQKQTITAYVDGQPVKPKTSVVCGTIRGYVLDISSCTANATTADPVCIGAGDSSCANEYFNGLIDEPTIFSDIVLTANDIKNLYAIGLIKHSISF